MSLVQPASTFDRLIVISLMTNCILSPSPPRALIRAARAVARAAEDQADEITAAGPGSTLDGATAARAVAVAAAQEADAVIEQDRTDTSPVAKREE